METTIDLRQEVSQLIEPWKLSESDPPCTHEELITICLVLHDKAMDMKAIIAWIFRSFKSYHAALFDFLVQEVGRYRLGSHKATDIFEALEEAFITFDLPVTVTQQDCRKCCEDDKECNENHECDPIETLLFTTSSSVARIFLRRLLPQHQGGTFPFMRLPAELRLTVYEMALQYPLSGLELPSDDPASQVVEAATRARSRSFSFEFWDDVYPECGLKLPPLDCILGLLRVDKKIHQEAMPCFYRLNTFVFRGIRDVLNLKSLLPVRRRELRHLVISHYPEPYYDDRGNEAFSLLASLKGLQRLEIHVDDGKWLTTRDPRYIFGDTFFIADTIPGFTLLPEIGESAIIEFAGDCPMVSSYWTSKIEKHKATLEAKSSKRNRAEEMEQPGRERKARKMIESQRSM